MEGEQRFVARTLVAGADDADQRRAQAGAAVVEFALVEQGQQRIEDRRVGLEHLVEKGDAGGGQVAVDQALVAVVLKGFERQRTEQLLGGRKARQQAFEIARAVEDPVQPARQLALGGAGRADQQHMLAGQRGQQQQPGGGLAFEQAMFERAQMLPHSGLQTGQPVRQLGCFGRLEVLRHLGSREGARLWRGFWAGLCLQERCCGLLGPASVGLAARILRRCPDRNPSSASPQPDGCGMWSRWAPRLAVWRR